MDAAMENPQLTPSVDGKRRRRLSTAAAGSVSKVLADDDLLMEILLRLGSPTTLVHAALVCKRWLLRHGSPSPPRLPHHQLHIWLHKGNTWSLVDSICLRGMVADLRMSGCMIEDDPSSPLRVNHLGDYAEFVFLEMGRCALHLDIKCRQLSKVFDDEMSGEVHPFMIWPPTFPVLKD